MGMSMATEIFRAIDEAYWEITKRRAQGERPHTRYEGMTILSGDFERLWEAIKSGDSPMSLQRKLMQLTVDAMVFLIELS